jgi:hypothetical protein
MAVDIFYDKLYTGSYTYYDDSFVKTMVFVCKNTADKNILKKFILLLFRTDRNDNDSLMHVNYKTILGFIIITGNFHYFDEILNDCNNENFNIHIESILEQLLTEQNFDIYKEYFCENYENMKVPTKINCKVKNVAEDDIITDDMSEKKLKKLRNKIKQEKNAVENNKNKMRTEIKDKITEFVQFYVNIDRKTANNIINYYLLYILKSYLADKYNLNLFFSEKKRKLTINEKINRLWYYKFTDKETNFKVLPYLMRFTHNFGSIEKTFSTCGETTLLNLLNYCLIQPDSTFDTSKIKNNDIVEFYRTKTMDYIYKNLRSVMHEWLDIVSTINEIDGIEVYNPSGDIHNNINNIAYILNKIIYDKEEIVRENHNDFIIKTIKYLKQKTLCVIQNSNSNSVSMKLDNQYQLFFYPGHGEMKSIKFTDKPKGPNYMSLIDLYNYKDEFDFAILYTLLNKIINNRNNDGEILDYNSSVSLVILTYFSKNIVEQYNDDGTENIVYLFLSSIKIYQEYVDLSGYMETGGGERDDDESDDDYYSNSDNDYSDEEDEEDEDDNESKFKKRDPKYDEKYKMTNILLQNLPNLTDLHLYYSYTDDFFENLSIYCNNLKKLEINWAKIDLDIKSISKNTNLESFIVYEANFNVKIINFEYLNNLVNIKDLYLELTQNLTKLPDLYLPELLKIDLNNLYNVTNLGNFDFPKLIDCSLGYSNKIEDISFIRNSKHLKKLSYWLNVKDYSFLDDLEELEELKMSGNINNKNITNDINFERLKNLKKLEISAKNFDLNKLTKNTELRSIHIEKSNIVDLKPLQKLINLEEIRLTDNPIEDLTPLLSFDNLKILQVGTFNYPKFTIELKKITQPIKDLLEKHKIQYTIISKSSSRSSPKTNRTTSKSSPKTKTTSRSRSSPKIKTTSRSSPKIKTTSRSRSSPKTKTTSRSSPKTKTTSRSSPKTKRS